MRLGTGRMSTCLGDGEDDKMCSAWATARIGQDVNEWIERRLSGNFLYFYVWVPRNKQMATHKYFLLLYLHREDYKGQRTNILGTRE